MKDPIVNFSIEEHAGIVRDREPCFFGIPLPKGLISPSSKLEIRDHEGNVIPTAITPLARWMDGSIKWMLFDMQVSLPAKGKKSMGIYPESSSQQGWKEQLTSPTLQQSLGKICVCTGNVDFELNANAFLPFSQITVSGHPLLRENVSRIVLIDEHEREWQTGIAHWKVETQNELRLVLVFEGPFIAGNDTHPLRYQCRIHYFAGRPTVRLDFTLWNPRPVHHPGGTWDLGDNASILFRDLNIDLAFKKSSQDSFFYSLDRGEPLQNISENFLIYQDSSGGDNWRSHNHINREEKIPVSFQGFEVRNKQHVVSRGLRATPCIVFSTSRETVAVSVKHFWQNFPKAFEVYDEHLNIRLFPKYFSDVFELQGGEQKTHTLYLDIREGNIRQNMLEWIHVPLIPQISPEWYYTSGACLRPVPPGKIASDVLGTAYQQLVDVAVQGDRSFFARREIIDEYGWRNFGDIYADHEAVFHQGTEAFVSHYNNQYDVIKGALIQFMRTGAPEWFQLADELAGHVADIDIYHTNQDRYEYNNGLFWHTDYHLDAATSTHRCISRKHREFKDPRFVGGGPSPAHNYATGVLYHYWLTGNPRAKESVLALAENIVKRLEGSDIVAERCMVTGKRLTKWLIRQLKRTPEIHDYEFDGPGRSSGNAVNTLLDAYLLTSNQNYLDSAEKLIALCVSLDDDIDKRDLLNAELRWMYNIFLQALGRYLDTKYESGQIDSAFWHARTVLLQYACWMLEREYPYLDKPEILEFPNETWSAQEIRKSDILAYAARYAPEPLRQKLLEKSRYFFEVCIKQLRDDFKTTNHFTRVLAILMTNGMVHLDAFSHFTCMEDVASKDIDYFPPDRGERRQKNRGGDQFIKTIRNTSVKREFHWIITQLEKVFSGNEKNNTNNDG